MCTDQDWFNTRTMPMLQDSRVIIWKSVYIDLWCEEWLTPQLSSGLVSDVPQDGAEPELHLQGVSA